MGQVHFNGAVYSMSDGEVDRARALVLDSVDARRSALLVFTQPDGSVHVMVWTLGAPISFTSTTVPSLPDGAKSPTFGPTT